ncbi:family 2 glycosyl transferase [Novosphingobium sp. Rr 2-17]|uniref:glycosyltransferase family 2 protein n=1 Tax=Novosphingobium sp. Rr 2-17 TaxID=555793 RepID=UPI0002699505|nr:glycosyltransferase [Novosphingobium sp. Rr 2-17]EIZ79858.1 family 2 glycosyl transferase [Novosphingobium sp. Rr 2-17]
MSLSVLTIVKDRPGHLAQLVEGLRRSDVAPDELVVVDMGSEPPVVIAQMPFPVRVVRLERDGLPLAAARNIAAQTASGEALLFLDVDCIPMRGLVDAVARVLDGNDALICAQVRYLGRDDARSDWHEADLLGRSSGHPVRRFPANGLRQVDDAGLFWSLVFGIRRQRFLDLRGFDEAFTGYGAEDTDFGFRAREAGLPLLFMGGPGAFHQHHDTFDPPLQHFEDVVRNARIFFERWQRWPMEGWLHAFERAGLIAWDQGEITVLRQPSPREIQRARVDSLLSAA